MHSPSLFQHIGTTSSLKGKIQNLKDTQFGEITTFYPHKDNPPAAIKTQMKSYGGYTLENGKLNKFNLLIELKYLCANVYKLTRVINSSGLKIPTLVITLS